MRTCVFVSFLMAASNCGVALAADAQTVKATGTNSKVAIAKSANAGLVQADELGAPERLASRPDANRYHWNNGQWWYHMPDNNWMRWNGAIWVRHNRASSFQPAGAGRRLNPASFRSRLRPRSRSPSRPPRRFATKSTGARRDCRSLAARQSLRLRLGGQNF